MEYPSDYEYVLMVYYKGPLVLDMMRWSVGQEEFLGFLSELYESNMFGILTTQEFIDSFNAYEFIRRPDAVLTDTIISPILPDVAIGDITWDGTILSIHPENPYELPCEMTLRYDDGSVEQLTSPYVIELREGRTPVSYLLDPDNNLLESDETNNEGTISAPTPDRRTDTALREIILLLALCAIGIIIYYKKRR